MISETDLVELGNSLFSGFFSDNVILALARTERTGTLQSNDRKIIKQACSLLDSVLRGEKWLDSIRLNTRSAESAIVFDRAVHALPDIPVPKQFVEYVANLRHTLQDLLNKDVSTKDDINKVRQFFHSYSRAILAESQRVLEKHGEYPGVPSWSPPSPETT